MLAQAVSLWRKLFGPKTTTQPSLQAVREERRSSIRFPVNHPITYQSAGSRTATTHPACVRDISLGGVKLSLDRPVETGDLLTLHLPCRGGVESNAVLACVVHVSQAAEEVWIVGCTFARPLTEEDLAPFLGEEHRPIREQRKAPRYLWNVRATYTIVNDPSAFPQDVEIVNVSNNGIAFQSQRLIDVGTMLSLKLSPPDGISHTILACVVRLDQGESGSWIVGCNFISELSEAMMASFSPVSD